MWRSANARPGYLEYLVPIVQRRRADGADGELPIVDNLIDYRLPDGSAFNDIEAATQMLGVFIGGTETVPKIVAHGLWELGRRPDQLAAVRADLGRECARRARGDDPVLRAGAVVRPHRAQAVHHPRHDDQPGSAHHHAARVGQPRRARVRQSRRLRLESAHRAPAGLRPGTALLPGVHLARLEIAIMVTEWLKRVDDWRIDSEAASRPPSSFQWGWNNIPVEV